MACGSTAPALLHPSATHYDIEVLDAPGLSESLRHGVTTVLLGSPKAEELAVALKGLASLMPQAGGARIKDREFLGRTIYSVTLPQKQEDGTAAPATDADGSPRID